MARPPRLEVLGGIFQITVRGNARGRIFRRESDRLEFLDLTPCDLWTWERERPLPSTPEARSVARAMVKRGFSGQQPENVRAG